MSRRSLERWLPDDLQGRCAAAVKTRRRYPKDIDRAVARRCQLWLYTSDPHCVFVFDEYVCSRPFLTHIDDPDYLPWIPVKQ